ncbi:uncharacterized protein LOC141621073 [Silene latifolia]|uniref:uncharacterized protein LOC141621073 n=1 Tax=Silene latifolia TaxID=37657 RepID=UPI003D779D5F
MTMTTIAEIEEYFNSFPPGYKFDPSDEELIIEYLLPRMKDDGKMHPNLMHDVNIYEHNPDYLAEKYCPQGNKGWYFFTPRDKKYPNGSRPNRQAGDGYWKATGADKAIQRDGVKVGSRRALVFYKGKPPKGEKTLWIMHEFRAAAVPSQVIKRKHSSINDGDDARDPNSMRLDKFILCRIYKKNVLTPKEKSEREQNEIFELQVDEMIEGESSYKESPVIDDINRGGNLYNVNTYGENNNNDNHNVNVYTTNYNCGDYPSVYPSVQPLIGSVSTNKLMADASISGMNVNPSSTSCAELLDWDQYQTYGNYNFLEDLNGDYNNDYENSLLHFLLDPQNPTIANPDLDPDPMDMISACQEALNMLNPPQHVTEEIEVKDVPLHSLPC